MGQRTNKQTYKNTRDQFAATCTLKLFFNDFIRKASIFHFVIHFPEATLDLAGLFAIPIRVGGKKERIMEISQVIQLFACLFFNSVMCPENFLNLQTLMF